MNILTKIIFVVVAAVLSNGIMLRADGQRVFWRTWFMTYYFDKDALCFIFINGWVLKTPYGRRLLQKTTLTVHATLILLKEFLYNNIAIFQAQRLLRLLAQELLWFMQGLVGSGFQKVVIGLIKLSRNMV